MNRGKSASLGLVSSLAASLCCIAPLAAAVGGVSGVASSVSRIEPARPYLVAVTLLLLGFAWVQQLRPVKADDCGCAVPARRSRLRSTGFLATVTVLAGALLTFPYYAPLLRSPHPVAPAMNTLTASNAVCQVTLPVKGMGCASCEPEVEEAVAKLPGIRSVKASCVQKNTVVRYDSTQTSIAAITSAINSTGYTVQALKP
ncbi:MAG: mercuric transport protein MerTP [Chitinophagaceae bacterium]|nr:MAG: mercuric transport protein MerTP [Chitinophagaceae bacterium]